MSSELRKTAEHPGSDARIEIHARRRTGGAIVRVSRGGAEARVYRVGLRRYNRLFDTLVAHRGAHGYYGRNGCDVVLQADGLQDSRRRAARGGSRRAWWWR